jgi:hypothetical protein
MRTLFIAVFFMAFAALLAACGWFSNVPAVPGDGSEEVVPDGEGFDDDGEDAPDTDDGDGEETFECAENAECIDDNLCNGEESCDPVTHTCLPGDALEDGFVCGSSPRAICLGEACVASTCGDGFLDTGAGEFCEPPGEAGCTDACTFACTFDGDCPDDGEICNGEPLCDPDSHVCTTTGSAADGTDCGESPGERRICLSGSCQQSVCGDGYTDVLADPPEECDDADGDNGDGCDNDCTFSCHGDAECEGQHDCASGSCNPTGHLCDFHPYEAGYACRPAAGVCDREEACNGSGLDCPSDGFAPSSVVCRSAVGNCDVDEMCTGSAADCPPNGYLEAGSACDDGNPLTDPDRCSADGRCLGTPIVDAVVQAEAGLHFTCALVGPGSAMCWGSNTYGQLGNGTSDERHYPVPVTGIAGSVVAISVGRTHACVVTDAGAALCWGRNEQGQLGDGTISNRSLPVAVVGLSSGVSAISAGRNSTCAVTTSGTVKCWGSNTYGQLGNGSTTGSTTPVDVMGLPSGAAAVSVGGYHACALLAGGGIYCWGDNTDGQLGDGTTTSHTTPMAVSGLSSGGASVSASRGAHTCAVRTTGAALCWGDNSGGQLGTGTTTDWPWPAGISSLTSGVSVISGGVEHSCAVAAGGATCWGANTYWEIGDGTTTPKLVPTSVLTLTSGIYSITAGERHSCAILDTGVLKCWGDNTYGALGDGSTTSSSTPVTVVFP